MPIELDLTKLSEEVPRVDSATSRDIHIELLPSGRKLEAASGQTILAASLGEGVNYPHGCKAGRCGNCKSRLVSGEVEMLVHSRFALSDDERSAGLILACCAVPKTDLTVSWLGDETDVPSHPIIQSNAEVVSIVAATRDIRILQLRVLDGPMMFSAGQYASVSLPGLPARDYSMASSPSGETLEFHVRLVPDGKVSPAMHGLVQGEMLKIEGPLGSAHLRHGHTGPVLAVAGGSGLAPILSILGTLVELGMRQPVHVYVGANSEHDIYGLERLQKIADIHDDMTITAIEAARYTKQCAPISSI